MPENQKGSADVDEHQPSEELQQPEGTADVMQQPLSTGDSTNRGRSQRTIKMPSRFNECYMKY